MVYYLLCYLDGIIAFILIKRAVIGNGFGGGEQVPSSLFAFWGDIQTHEQFFIQFRYCFVAHESIPVAIGFEGALLLRAAGLLSPRPTALLSAAFRVRI